MMERNDHGIRFNEILHSVSLLHDPRTLEEMVQPWATISVQLYSCLHSSNLYKLKLFDSVSPWTYGIWNLSHRLLTYRIFWAVPNFLLLICSRYINQLVLYIQCLYKHCIPIRARKTRNFLSIDQQTCVIRLLLRNQSIWSTLTVTFFLLLYKFLD